MSTKAEDRIELLQGTLDLLILRTLRLGATHGHAIAKAIERGSDDVLQVEQGSLYPALHRLIKRGWIAFDDGTSDNNRRAKFYYLTFQVQPHDVVTYAGVAGALGLLSLLATYLGRHVEPRGLIPSSRFVRSESNPAPLFGHRIQAACRRASSRLNSVRRG